MTSSAVIVPVTVRTAQGRPASTPSRSPEHAEMPALTLR